MYRMEKVNGEVARFETGQWFYGRGHGAFTLPGFGVHYAPDLTIEPSHLSWLAVDLAQEGAVGQLT